MLELSYMQIAGLVAGAWLLWRMSPVAQTALLRERQLHVDGLPLHMRGLMNAGYRGGPVSAERFFGAARPFDASATSYTRATFL